MGIQGLTSYMNQLRTNRKHELYDTKLVIDGLCLCYYLFGKSKCNSMFGGDYDLFIKVIKNYFNQLLVCNIQPLVIFDGGVVNKKHDTIIKRYMKSTKDIEKFNPNSDTLINTVLMKNVFQEVLIGMKIYCAQAMFEADDSIASVAKILHCPVLSFDSDFYIYDVEYITFKKLKMNLFPGYKPNTYIQTCYIYEVSLLQQHFQGLDASVMPLLAALLGNDYGDETIFDDFYNTLEIKCLENEKNRPAKIRVTLEWLQYKSINSAVEEILKTLPATKRYEALKTIELTFNSYETLTADLLIALGFPEKEIQQVIKKIEKPPYKYSGKVPLLKQETKEENEFKSDLYDTSFLSKIPDWFRRELYKGLYPGVIVDLFTGEVLTFGTPMQDLTKPSVYEIVLPLIVLIKRLLNKGVIEYKPLQFMDRSTKGAKNNILFMKKTFNSAEQVLTEEIPSLHDLRNLPSEIRKKMMDEAIGITADMKMEEIHKPWQLYVGTIVYWLKQDVHPRRNKFYIYAVLFSMLHSIIDSKIGTYRSQEDFNAVHGDHYKQLIRKKKELKELPLDINLTHAISKVTKEDCIIMSKQFFIQMCCVNNELKEANRFNATIVHVYNMFQMCLKFVITLNTLLGSLYEKPAVGNLVKGTLLYNLYCHFKGHCSIETYIEKEVFKPAPSLLRVYKILLIKVKKMCDLAQITMFKDSTVVRKATNNFYPF